MKVAATDSSLLKPQPLSAAAYTTYRVGGMLAQAYCPQTAEETLAVVKTLAPQAAPLAVLGWGSNTLVASCGIAGPALVLRKLNGFQALGQGRFRFDAGVHLAKVATMAVEAGFSGAEFFIGIPGTVGGAVVMNAGAMGQETANVVERVLLADLTTGEADWVEAGTLGFGYRQSRIQPGRHLVVAVDCCFQPGDADIARQRMADNLAFRKQHHPTEPNAGSVFRNPNPQQPVGKLVDQLGGRGVWQVGGARISPKHGNFIINTGQATSGDVLQLMRLVQQRVAEAYGLAIYPENRVLGDFTADELALWQVIKQGDPHGE